MPESQEKPYLLLLNGPNLNRLGTREPSIYGTATMADVEAMVKESANLHGVDVLAFQSNHEGHLIDFLQAHGYDAIGVVVNPGALAHYGYALRDCLADLNVPVVEVHISNVHRREPFRHQLVLAPVVAGQIVGLGIEGYRLATTFVVEQFVKNSEEEKV